MAKLWAKKGNKLHPLIEKYTVGTDYIFDAKLMPYDIQATKAHAKGLQQIGIFKAPEIRKIFSTLNKLEKDFKKGRVKITVQDEDCHTVIENYLTRKIRKLGLKIHTGRSRNDQVLTALRLYMKDQLKTIRAKTKKLAREFLDFAQKYQHIPLPGYSHAQQAMLSSIGHYGCSMLESLLDDINFLDYASEHLNKNPLGSAAGFGVSLLLDRELTTKEMKFRKIQINSLYCQNSRGKFESIYLESLVQIMLTLSRFATDLLLFTSQEFNFFTVKNNLVTGSSIMPQKRNLDAMELLRGFSSVVISNQFQVKDVVKGLISGYNRDLQLIKKPLFESTEIVLDSLDVVDLYLKGITPNEKSIMEKINKNIFTADIATNLAKNKKMPFRTAYQKAMKLIKKEKIDSKYIKENLKTKVSLGAAGNLDLQHYKYALSKL
ncbi:argininosuccinate lyase [Candidatus Peregrinibacteria bacterium]|nr:argininosuccinate lyase [Candidatus Peregrinibacteria bacterium]